MLAADLYLPNGIRALKNLHTARERAHAEKLIVRYYQSGIAGLKRRSAKQAAHAYGALAAIRRLARFELPRAKRIAKLATFYMEGLRRWQLGRAPRSGKLADY